MQSQEQIDQTKKICSTDLEFKVLTSFINCLYAEPGFSDVCVNEISYETKLSKPVVKGVVGSLCKKGILFVDDDNYFKGILYLNNKYWYLHPEWKNETPF